MFRPEGLIRASVRWLNLLQRSTVEQAAAILRSELKFADLSLTQYALALEWLEQLQIVRRGVYGLELSPEARVAPEERARLLFARSLESSSPTWLPDADVLVLNTQELPEDASRLAQWLDLPEREVLALIREVHGHIDLAQRHAVGAAGERALLDLLESVYPGSTRYVAQVHDGFGYDLAVKVGGIERHLEVKSTTRRGRLTVHLSRHEYEIAKVDPAWVLVVVGLSQDNELRALGTVETALLLTRAPADIGPGTAWESARYDFAAGEVRRGLNLGPATSALGPLDELTLSNGIVRPDERFVWLGEPRVPEGPGGVADA